MGIILRRVRFGGAIHWCSKGTLVGCGIAPDFEDAKDITAIH
jgi:hypothetical protein